MECVKEGLVYSYPHAKKEISYQRSLIERVKLEPIYEQDFLDCSYGFRPGRSAHQALDAIWRTLIEYLKVPTYKHFTIGGERVMTKLDVLQSYAFPERTIDSVAWIEGIVMFAGPKGIVLQHENSLKKGETGESFQVPVKTIAGMASDGTKIFVTDKKVKKLFQIDAESKKSKHLFDFVDIKYKGHTQVFHSNMCEITDMEWAKGFLWVACAAGYSSLIYKIDVTHKSVAGSFHVRGPRPEGISFDKKDKYIWVVDGSNRELSSFSEKGEWTETALPSPIGMPRSLSLDNHDNFWTADMEKSVLCQIGKGGK